MSIYESAEQLIGNTPLLSLKRIKEKLGLKAEIIAKLEFQNPAGSIKDRVALYMINAAERDGLLKPDSVIIEPTSGNTGIGIAAVCATRGYKAIIVMPSTMSPERVKLMRAYGAEVILTDGALGMAGSIEEAERLKKKYPSAIIAGQFYNPENPKAHYETTGPEIYKDTDGKLDFFVAGVGTGGTLSGAGKFLKEKIENVKVVAVEPKGSPVLTEGRAGKHGIQGIGAGFIPENLDTGIYDEVIAVTEDDAYEMARALAKCEGVLVGISSGAALFAAVKLAEREENENKRIVVILPDTGMRYLSGDLFI
ncbi:MAG: cysteine synthase A [Clostridia bacterium]|nr:cysteine synthase A [Clostridia bacterium]